MPTWTRAPLTPFGVSPERILLRADPLVRVLAQIRFAPVLSIREQSFIAPFQEAIRHAYPLVEKEMQQHVAQGVGGELHLGESVLWRFSDAERNWQVTLAQDFVALDCSNYSDRTDFVHRLDETLQAVGAHVRPVLTSRIGVRYTNRLREKLDQLPDFVRPALLGLANANLGAGEVVNELTQAEFTMNAVNLQGRWGHLPANATHDPSIEALDRRSWILDLDAYTAVTTPFDPKTCAEETERFAGIVYGFFRWAVSDEFLGAHGAQL
ncbi:MAG: TIGR04255 family protein [Acidimicrobiaceae bacterium]|nr:TIGR04255 family protein [Acidimicrobiaceae bacterium]